MKTFFKHSLLAGFSALLFSAPLWAVVDNIPVNVEFVAPITLTSVDNLSYGLLDVNMAAAETIVLDPDDTISADAGANVLGGTQTVGTTTVTATATQTLVISVAQNTGGTYWDVATFMCSYNGGGDNACSGGGYTATSVASGLLEVGATLTAKGVPVAGVDNGSIDVTVVYQ